jgi:hypothetical protein
MAVTKTLGPLHFEDLEPHRFEDLVRELVYDFRDWQSIEATGRGGSDEGFDIRAYERAAAPERDPGEDERAENEGAESDESPHPMEGNLWMFQCKREAEIGPREVAKIIDDGVKADKPPYGYVLAAPANFSKKSFDVFREELRKRGVMEFYLWGRAALEDMLHLPKNDRVLFTFFGISLVTRRRSRATDIRAIVTRKNKLIRIFGEQPSYEPILVRDLKDTHYPDSSQYQDFDDHPRWRAYTVVGLDPRGLVLEIQEYFAYRDPVRGEWDMAEELNLARRQENDEDDLQKRREDTEIRERVEAFWRFIPHSHRVTYVSNGLVKFEDIDVIDDKGDSQFHFPHIFVDFHDIKGPFFGFARYLKIHEHRRETIEGLKRVDHFPSKIGAPRIGTVHSTKLKVTIPAARLVSAGNARMQILYAVDDRFDFLSVADVIAIEGTEGKPGTPGEPTLIQITHKRMLPGKAFLESLKDDPTLMYETRQQIGRDVAENDQLRILEFKITYQWAVDRARAQSAKGGD